MEAPQEKPKKHEAKKHEAKKHIEFKDVDKNDGPKKEQGYSRGKSSKLGPKYDRELKKFREETLQKVKIFRNARIDWIRLTGSEIDGQQIDSKIYHGLQIDKRRTAIMKKLGFKTNMVRPHRKTLRPRQYFTMKKKVAILDSDRGERPHGDGRLAESPVIREFRKKAKKATLKMARKMALESEKLVSDQKPDTGDKVSESSKHDKVTTAEPLKEPIKEPLKEPLKDQQSDVTDKDGELPDTEPLKTEEGDAKDKELLTEEVKVVGELQSKESKLEFDKILKELKVSFGFDEYSVTDEDKEEMKKLWKEYRLRSVETTKKRRDTKPREKIEEEGSFKFLQKLSPKKGKWWLKRRKRVDYKTEWPKDAKPCTCQILEGDSVFIVKNVCECAVQCKRTKIITGTQNEETPSPTDGKVITVPPKPGLSSSIASKIVDSLEVIRRRVASKASRISKASTKEKEDKENATDIGPEPLKLKEKEIEDIYVPNQKFDSATSVSEKPLDNEPDEQNKAPAEEQKPAQTQGSDVQVLDEEVGTVTDLKKLKTKKHPKAPQKDDIVPPKIKNKKAAAKERQDSSPKKSTGVKEAKEPKEPKEPKKEKKAKEVKEVKEAKEAKEAKEVNEAKEAKEVKVVKVEDKETKPRKTWSAASGKGKTDTECITVKTVDDSEAVKTDTQVPKPILGKVKCRKTKVNREHVSFDVGAGRSPSSSFLKYGEKKMKTVLSVVNIIKKN